MLRRFAALGVIAALCVSAAIAPTSAATLAELKLRSVALSDELPRSSTAPELFAQISGVPVIENDGSVAFVAVHGEAASGSSVWIDSPNGLRCVIRSGDSAPTTGGNFAQFSGLVIADGGTVAFRASVTGTPGDAAAPTGLWLEHSGDLISVAQTGQVAPSPAAELRFSNFETPAAVNGAGQTAFFARTRDKEGGLSQSSGMWMAEAADLSLVANAGEPVDAAHPDIVFSPQSFEAPFAEDPVVSPSGQTIFRGFLAGAGLDDGGANGLWSYSPADGLQLLLKTGDAAVGTGGKPFISFPSIPTINAAGDTAFLGFFGTAEEHRHDSADQTVEPVVGGNDQAHDHDLDSVIGLGMWLRRASGALQPIFMIGGQAPGIAQQAHFVDTFDPVMNAAGNVAFLAAVEGDDVESANEVGLWSNARSAEGSLQLVARQGDSAPGGAEDFKFGVFLEPSLNAAGQTAFMAAGFQQLDGQVIDNAFGIWGQDRRGNLQLVARVGQLLAIDLGDERQIAALAFASETGGQDGKARGLNDRGQLVFRAAFTDGTSGIFVSDVLTLPESPSLALLIFAANGLARVRRPLMRVHRPTMQAILC